MITLNTENKVSTKIRLEDLYNSDREKIAEQVVRFNNISNTFLKIFNINVLDYQIITKIGTKYKQKHDKLRRNHDSMKKIIYYNNTNI